MAPFQAAGERARWRMLYELLLPMELGDVVTYKDMAEALSLHADDDRHTLQMAFRRAAKEYEMEDSRATEAVPNVGYRIVEPKEHLRLAKEQQKRSGKALERGHSKVVHVDFNGMEPEIRKAFEVTAQVFSTLLDYNRRLSSRQEQLEEAMESMAVKVDRNDEDLAELKARLARLEGEHSGEEGS